MIPIINLWHVKWHINFYIKAYGKIPIQDYFFAKLYLVHWRAVYKISYFARIVLFIIMVNNLKYEWWNLEYYNPQLVWSAVAVGF